MISPHRCGLRRIKVSGTFIAFAMIVGRQLHASLLSARRIFKTFAIPVQAVKQFPLARAFRRDPFKGGLVPRKDEGVTLPSFVGVDE
jgi:hypothetical protein